MPARPAKRRRAAAFFESVERRLLMATQPVLNTADTGAGSLRAVIAAAAAGDTIDLTKLAGTIKLGSPIAIDKSLTLLGSGQSTLTINGKSNATTAFNVDAVALTIRDLTIDRAGTANADGAIVMRNGAPADGAAAGSLTLERVTMSNNLTNGRGGAIYSSYAQLTVRDSTFVNNAARGYGSNAGGAIFVTRSAGLSVVSSTFANNAVYARRDPATAAPAEGQSDNGYADGGALIADMRTSGGPAMTVANCTFVGNAATIADFAGGDAAGGAFQLRSAGAMTVANNTIVNNGATSSSAAPASIGGIGASVGGAGTLSLVNNLIAGNAAAAMPDLWLGAGLTASASNNLVGDGAGSTLANGARGNLVGTTAAPLDAGLDDLADNGGPVQTMSLQATSLAIDAGTAAGDAPAFDARGRARVGATDLGAFEDPTGRATALVPFVLTIDGADAGDDVHVWLRNNGRQVRSVVNGKTRNYDAKLVLKVEVRANGGNDRVEINAGRIAAFVNGGDGNDEIYGGEGDDTLNGNGGRDTIVGGGGADAIRGHGGDDSLFGNGGDDRLYGGDGDDVIRGNAGDDSIDGEDGNDTLYGFDGDDRIAGGEGADYLLGMGGNDRMSGDGSSDTLNGGEGADTISGGSGRDAVLGDEGNDVLNGDEGMDSLFGGEGNDTIHGGDGRDTIGGDEGDDLLYGDAGNDGLLGDEEYAGNDTLYGGSGNDTLMGSNGRDTFYANDGESDDVYGDLREKDDYADVAYVDKGDRVSGVTYHVV